MSDLIIESEFIKKPYNPWKIFCIFYGIAILLVTVTNLVIDFETFVEQRNTLYSLITLYPISIVLAMFLYRKENFSLDLTTRILSIFVLVACQFIVVITFFAWRINFFAEYNYDLLILHGEGILTDYIVQFGLCCLAVLLLSAYTKRKQARKFIA